MGVRIITLVHYRNNEPGEIMASYASLDPGPYKDGLTPAGQTAVERMKEMHRVRGT